MKTILFTKEGFDKLKKEYQFFLNKRPEAVGILARAREMGDLSENGLYKAARMELSSIDYNLRRLKLLISRAKVVEKPPKGTVGITSRVALDDGKARHDFYIVGRYEANPSKAKISNESPIGKALIGKRVGESIKVNTPKGEIIYTILKVE